jgi:UDP-N-acetylglucosamine 2-epimerase (non-hydrolysing)
VLLDRKPDVVLVYGDVNSTVAAALVCAKLGVRVGHVEAGLRSFDRTMPEEINRLVTDQLADLLFTPSEDGDFNLQKEGVPTEKIFRVGNVMIDSLVKLLPAAQGRKQNGLGLPQPLRTPSSLPSISECRLWRRSSEAHSQSLLEV